MSTATGRRTTGSTRRYPGSSTPTRAGTGRSTAPLGASIADRQAQVAQRRASVNTAGDAGMPAHAPAVGSPLTLAGGLPGKVVELRSDGAMVDVIGGGTQLARWGTRAVVDGQHVTLVAPDSAELARRERIYHHLRRWRDDTARAAAVSARQVCDDATLQLIAARRPRDLAELASIRSFGAKRADRWGDDLLVALDAVRDQ